MNDFLKTAANRAKSPTPKFWRNMQPVLGSALGGIAGAQAMLTDGDPRWIKWALAILAGAIGYFVPKLGSTDQSLTHK